MSQNDMVIANQGFAAFRADLNGALGALASTSKGAARPATPYAGQLWIDDDTPSATVWTLYVYDGVDDIRLGTIDSTNNRFVPWAAVGARVASKTGAYTVSQSERGELHTVAHATGFTVTLVAAATATNGFTIGFLNTGAGDITIDGSGAETIDGQATIVLPPGQSLSLVCDGTNWRSMLAGSLPSGCAVARSGAADQTLATGVVTKIQWTVVDWDPQNEYDEATNFRFQPKIAGTYLVTAKARLLSAANGTSFSVKLYKTGTQRATVNTHNNTGGLASIDATVTKALALATTDYIEAFASHDSGANKDIEGDADFSWMTITRIA